MSSDPQDTYRSIVVAIFCGGLYLIADAIARSLYSGYGFTTRLSIIRHRRGCGSGCSGVRQRTRRPSSRTVLRSQRHNHRQSIGTILMEPSNKPMRTVYFDPKRVGSYGGVDNLRRVMRMPRKRVAEWLSEQDATLWRRVRCRQNLATAPSLRK